MEAGASAAEAMAQVVAEAAHVEYRQLMCVDRQGRVASHSGAKTLGTWALAEGEGAIAGGNLLANEGVPAAMLAGFAAARGSFGDRLVAGLLAAMRWCGWRGRSGAFGGASGCRPRKLAGGLLRADWSEAARPIEEVARAWEVYQPQMAAYIQRAKDPAWAPPTACGRRIGFRRAGPGLMSSPWRCASP